MRVRAAIGRYPIIGSIPSDTVYTIAEVVDEYTVVIEIPEEVRRKYPYGWKGQYGEGWYWGASVRDLIKASSIFLGGE